MLLFTSHLLLDCFDFDLVPAAFLSIRGPTFVSTGSTVFGASLVHFGMVLMIPVALVRSVSVFL